MNPTDYHALADLLDSLVAMAADDEAVAAAILGLTHLECRFMLGAAIGSIAGLEAVLAGAAP